MLLIRDPLADAALGDVIFSCGWVMQARLTPDEAR
jgi:hypothetical protein